MARGFHNTTIYGNIGRAPELRHFPNGDAVAEFGVCVEESYKNKTTGEKVETKEWYNVRCYRRLAELVAEHRKQGDVVMISGKMKTDSWEKDGVTHYKTYLNAQDIRGYSQGPAIGPPDSGPAPAQPEPTKEPERNPDFYDDDIPF